MDKSEVKNEQSSNNSIAALKEYFQKKYPNEAEDQIMVRILDHMKNQFFSTFPTKNKEETMSTSSQGSMTSNMFEGLAGESQPEDNEPYLEDYWDAMAQAMTRKGKAPQ
ncbi:hypothetical protein A2U01_0039737 [Trifolium medium]|uniref:Uncharacterized protein n=1 Tax=Trifolium medium TaxID=97028 RepID=A0A392Q2F8_9FABA|nr:hypothetical protein [Trifolium medium]